MRDRGLPSTPASPVAVLDAHTTQRSLRPPPCSAICVPLRITLTLVLNDAVGLLVAHALTLAGTGREAVQSMGRWRTVALSCQRQLLESSPID